MRESRYLRMAFMFGDNNASTFKRNLEKMIALVLHDCYSNPLTVTEQIEELKENYGLEFTETEIMSAITARNQNRIICVNNARDRSLRTYSITPETKEKIDQKIKNTIISDTIDQFLSQNEDIKVTPQDFRELLNKYFYSVFNSNAATISELLDQQKTVELSDDVSFTLEEKVLINRFLEWDNSVKNQCVYQMVSCCFDYCMMTVKRDKSIYQNMFRQKKFYLDTNIIFRMMGLNRENRKRLIDSFITKCKVSGIELRYTNHTLKEITDTIDHHVEQIKDLLKRKEPISVEALRVLSSKYYNLSFYEAYVEWCDDLSHQTGDYKSFSTDLKRQANSVLCGFIRKDFDDYKLKKPEEFIRYCDNLKAEKRSRRGYVKDEVVEADINNYMFVREQNDIQGASDFSNTHNYLISADHVLGDWDRKNRPFSVPIVELPSVWYSLILQYTGRTDNDFESFTRFLNFSLVSREEEENPIKIAILKKVIELDEPTEIKERIIFDIENKLQGKYDDFDSVDEVVELSHETILDQERRKLQEAANMEIETIKAAAETERKRIEDEKNAEISRLKADHAKAELTASEKNRELLDRIDLEKAQAVRDTVEKIVDKELIRVMTLYWFLTITGIGIFSILAIITIIKISNGQLAWLPEIYEKTPFLIDIFIEVVLGIINFVLFTKVFCGLDRDKIRERLLRKHLQR